jgi:hypothetical protein
VSNDKPTTEELNRKLDDRLDLWSKAVGDRAVERLKDDIHKLVRQAMADVWETASNAVSKYNPREHFLDYVLDTAICSGDIGRWMAVVEHETYHHPETWPSHIQTGPYKPASASIVELGDDDRTQEVIEGLLHTNAHFDIDHEVIERGLYRIRMSTPMPDKGTGNWERHLTSIEGLSQQARRMIIQADLTNEAGDIDAVYALAILEIALFNEVRY